jgi:uncharacterized protein with HEPN domain
MILPKDLNLLLHIIQHCKDIESARTRFGDSYNNLSNDIHYKNSTITSITQISELGSHLSDAFKQQYVTFDWAVIKRMRNVVVHKYGNIDLKILWETISLHVPKLKNSLTELIAQNQAVKPPEIDTEQQPERHGPKLK